MHQKPNVLIIVDDFSKGGTASVVDILIRGLNTYQPVLACLDAIGNKGEALKKQGIKVFDLQRQPGFDWKLTGKLAGLIRQEKIALVNAHQYTAYFYGTLAAIRAGFTKVVFTEHGRHYPDVCKPVQVLINKTVLLPCTAAVTAVSEAVKQSLITYEGIPARRIRILVNGINTRRFKLNEDERKTVRTGLGYEASDLLVGMVARLGQEKDHETLLKAMPIICEKIPEIKLLIIGEGPKRIKLEKLAQELGINRQIAFTGSRKDIPELLAALDLVVLSSFYEGTSITLLEAMAAGKATIASNVGGNDKVVVDGKTGFLFKQGDYQELARKVISLLSDKTLRQSMGEQGRKIVCERFSGPVMVKEYECLYDEVLKG